jgi:putative membrane protein
MMKPILAAGFATALAVAAPTAQAQSSPPQKPTQQQTQAQPDKASQTFIKNAMQGNLAEIDVGKLAQEKGQNDAVKKFGVMLTKDHSAANVKATEVAGQLNVTPPSGSSLTQKATYAKLKMLSGSSFDKSFAKSMVSDHESDIKEYEKQAQKTDAAGAFAKETLPTLKKHLQEAQQLQKQLEQATSSTDNKPKTTGSK